MHVRKAFGEVGINLALDMGVRVAVCAEMEQEDIGRPWLDSLPKKAYHVIIGQMAASAANTRLEGSGVAAGAQGLPIIVRFYGDSLATRGTRDDLLIKTSQIAGEEERALPSRNGKPEGIHRIVTDGKWSDVDIAQGDRRVMLQGKHLGQR